MKASSLEWFPVHVARWISLLGLRSLAARGAIFTAALQSWNQPDPGTLPADPMELADVLQFEDPDGLAAVRSQWRPLPEDPSRLGCAWMIELYREQRARYESAASRGRSGGRPPKSSAKAQLKPSESSAKAQPKPRKAIRLEETLSVPAGQRESLPPASGDASAGSVSVGRGGATSTDPADAPLPADDVLCRWEASSPDAAAAIETLLSSGLSEVPDDDRERARPVLRNLARRAVFRRLQPGGLRA